MFYWDVNHHDEVREALESAGRYDLIGTRPDCLVPRPPAKAPCLATCNA